MALNQNNHTPLAGIKVLDLSRILAGPTAAQSLADLGADVVKVERPHTGDDTRHWGPPFAKSSDGKREGESAYFISANRGKRSVTIDIATEEGQQLVRQLAGRADILIENFKVGGLQKYHLDYPALYALNPGLIYCSITGFGLDGPYKNRPGYDFMIQGMSGMMSVTGKPDDVAGGEPMRAGVAVSDLFAGLHAVIGILAALHRRNQTGLGEHIDIALLDVQVAMMANQASNYLNGDQVPGRIGNTHPNIVPYQVFRAKDQSFILAVGNDKQFAQLCKLIEAPQLAVDKKFLTNEQRLSHRDELVAELSAIFKQRPAGEWLHLCEKVGVPAGPINALDQVFADPQVKARNLRVEMPSSSVGKVSGVACPIRMKNFQPAVTLGPPALGEHTEEVLSDWLGASEDDKSSL